jgi:PAS domain S-box-containing protein
VALSNTFKANLGSVAVEILERVYQTLPVMMYVVDADGLIVSVNDFWVRRLGYAPQDVIGRPSSTFMVAGNDETRRKVWADLSAGREVVGWSVQYVAASGEIVEGLLYGAPIMGSDRRLEGAIATVFDVTAQRVAERQRDRLEQELRLAQKLEAIGQLAAGIAHEINTPSQYVSDNLAFLHETVQNILPLLDALPELIETAQAAGSAKADTYRDLLVKADLDYVREEMIAAIKQAREGTAQIKKIVLAMKDFSHPGSESKEPVDINRAVEATVTIARNEWKYVADLELALDSTLPLIAAVPSAINQVLLNLIINAAHAVGDVVAKAGGTKGVIRISTRRDGDCVEIVVADTGCGIPKENLSRIFDPFFTTKPVGKGTGQGLAIAHRVVTVGHGGTITVESEVGKGTSFCVRLPVGGGGDTT